MRALWMFLHRGWRRVHPVHRICPSLDYKQANFFQRRQSHDHRVSLLQTATGKGNGVLWNKCVGVVFHYRNLAFPIYLTKAHWTLLTEGKLGVEEPAHQSTLKTDQFYRTITFYSFIYTIGICKTRICFERGFQINGLEVVGLNLILQC